MKRWIIVCMLSFAGSQIVLFQANKDGMSSSVIAMLAAQTAEYYNSTHNAMNSSNLKNNLDKVRFQPIVITINWFPEQSWPRQTKIKSTYFDAMANYHAAIGLHAKDLYGEEVARLQMALTCIGDEFVKSNLRKTTTEFQEWFNNLSEVCSPPVPSLPYHH